MMYRLRRYDAFAFQIWCCSTSFRNDAMFAQCAVRHTSFAKRTSWGVAVIICRRQTSFKKAWFVGRQIRLFYCQRAVKRCVNTGKNSKKYTKSKLFKASKKVSFVLRDKRLHICFTCAKRNYTFQKTSVIISPDIYLQGIFGQFLFIWIFILLGFFCKINYVWIRKISSVLTPPIIRQTIILNFVPI